MAALCLVAVCGCGPLAAKTAWQVLMEIGTQVVISEGLDHVKRLVGGGEGEGEGKGPVVQVQHGDAAGNVVNVAYRVEGTAGVLVTVVKGEAGEVSVSVGEGGNVRVAVKPGTSASIALSQSDRTAINTNAQAPGGREPAVPESSPRAPAPPAESSGEPLPAGLVGTWEGRYTCTQGETGLRLTIQAGSAPGEVQAIFSFFPLPSNDDVPSGSYRMRGTYASGQLRLEGYEWIEHPFGYSMVDLTAQVDPRADRIQGTVESSTCRGFSVRRR